MYKKFRNFYIKRIKGVFCFDLKKFTVSIGAAVAIRMSLQNSYLYVPNFYKIEIQMELAEQMGYPYFLESDLDDSETSSKDFNSDGKSAETFEFSSDESETNSEDSHTPSKKNRKFETFIPSRPF